VELEIQSDSSCLITLSFDIKTIQDIYCWCCLHVSLCFITLETFIFFDSFDIDMNAFDRTARDDRQGSS